MQRFFINEINLFPLKLSPTDLASIRITFRINIFLPVYIFKIYIHICICIYTITEYIIKIINNLVTLLIDFFHGV